MCIGLGLIPSSGIDMCYKMTEPPGCLYTYIRSYTPISGAMDLLGGSPYTNEWSHSCTPSSGRHLQSLKQTVPFPLRSAQYFPRSCQEVALTIQYSTACATTSHLLHLAYSGERQAPRDIHLHQRQGWARLGRQTSQKQKALG